MYKFIATFLLCFSFSYSFSQELWFTNAAKNKVIKARVGNMVYVTYKGYNGQHEFATQILSEITDSTITLGLGPGNVFGAGKKYTAAANAYKVINIKDITAFRKRSVGGVSLNALISAGSVVGSVFLLDDLIRTNNISTGNALLISLGAGLVVRYGTMLLFPVNAKYKMSDGWKAQVMQPLD